MNPSMGLLKTRYSVNVLLYLVLSIGFTLNENEMGISKANKCERVFCFACHMPNFNHFDHLPYDNVGQICTQIILPTTQVKWSLKFLPSTIITFCYALILL